VILVDSSVWISFFNGEDIWQVRLLDSLLSEVPVVMGDLILTEVLQGFRSDKDFNAVKKSLDSLPFREMGGYKVALRSALNFRYLQKRGIKVRKTVDLVIGTFCIHENLVLLHDDRDFDPMERFLELKVLSP
jgi:predicted nucleic acid-binding protein